jgi:hypothetical protein
MNNKTLIDQINSTLLGNNLIFKTFEEARLYYNIPDDKLYLKIIDHPRSLNKIHLQGKIVHYIGNGVKLHPGYPGGNQLYASQLPIIRHFSNYNTIYIFRKLLNGDVVCMGQYAYQTMKKNIALTGFTYYEIKLYRKEEFFYTKKI